MLSENEIRQVRENLQGTIKNLLAQEEKLSASEGDIQLDIEILMCTSKIHLLNGILEEDDSKGLSTEAKLLQNIINRWNTINKLLAEHDKLMCIVDKAMPKTKK